MRLCAEKTPPPKKNPKQTNTHPSIRAHRHAQCASIDCVWAEKESAANQKAAAASINPCWVSHRSSELGHEWELSSLQRLIWSRDAWVTDGINLSCTSPPCSETVCVSCWHRETSATATSDSQCNTNSCGQHVRLMDTYSAWWEILGVTTVEGHASIVKSDQKHRKV